MPSRVVAIEVFVSGILSLANASRHLSPTLLYGRLRLRQMAHLPLAMSLVAFTSFDS
jgi:hypothetical protein